jgi:hypothetical protein
MALHAKRPHYENEKTLAEENRFREIFEAKYPKYALRKLPMSYGYDFACLHKSNDRLSGLIEYRQRNYTFEKIKEFGGYKVSLQKWKHLYQWREQFNVVCLFFVHLADCSPTQFYRYEITKGDLNNHSLEWWDCPNRGGEAENELSAILRSEDLHLVDLTL